MSPLTTVEDARHSWQRTEELFYAAAELPEDERKAFLVRACAGDLAWALEVERLLGAEADADRRIEGVIASTIQLVAQDKPATTSGLARVGNYKILRELGRGGMSTVYLAERADEHYRKLVAIKVVKRGMDTGEILRRLRQERQILAQLEHPHISRLLDGGNTEDGRPYFVMEYVDGEPIDQYCRRLRVSVEGRLALFRDVLTAVEYAHRNLVVHRDLKPANILVTGSGEVKLLDFGIAKLLDPERAAEFGATSAALRFFTLNYASPEQILGRPLNTASDVYSLGVLLFELLTDRRPHDSDLSRLELESAICEQDPPPPSECIDAGADEVGSAEVRSALVRARRRRLQGDLDAIVLTAIQRDERRRYASVERFADDLQRHLQGLTVRARSDSFAYRTRKFLRRHRLAVAGTSVAVIVLTALVTFYTVRLASERNRARIEGHKSQQVAAFLRGLFENADPARGPQVTARELLDQGAARINTELADQPEVRAELMDLMGSVYLDLGLTEDADPLLRVSEDLRRAQFGEQSAESLTSRLHRGRWHHAVGDYAQAEATFESLLRTLSDAGVGEVSQHAEALGALGDLRYDQGRIDEAEDLFRRALEIRRELHGDEHPQVATGLNDLGVALYARGELDAAEVPLRQALELHRRLLGANHPHLAITLSSLGVLRLAQADHEEAAELLESALEIRRVLYGDEHPSVAQILNNLGELCRRRGDLPAAVEYLSEALEIIRKIQGINHPAYADGLSNLARAVQMRGDGDAALDLYRQAVAATRRAYGADNKKLAFILRNLGDALIGQGDRGQAEKVYEEALTLSRRLYPSGHWRLSFPLSRLGQSRLEDGDPRGAEPLLREALDIRQEQRPDHWRTAETRSWLGSCWIALGREKDGEKLLTEALAQLREDLGDEAPATIAAVARCHPILTVCRSR